MLNRIEFLFSEALIAMRRNGLMTFAAVSNVAVSLFLMGVFYHLHPAIDRSWTAMVQVWG